MHVGDGFSQDGGGTLLQSQQPNGLLKFDDFFAMLYPLFLCPTSPFCGRRPLWSGLLALNVHAEPASTP